MLFSSLNLGKIPPNLTCAYFSDGLVVQPPSSLEFLYIFFLKINSSALHFWAASAYFAAVSSVD